MPQRDRNDEDFWMRSRRTRQSDKRSKRGRKRNDGDGGAEIDWTDPDLPSAAPPSGRGRRGQGAPGPPPQPAGPPPRTLSPRVAAAQRAPAPVERPRRAPEAPSGPAPFLDDPPLGGAPPPLPSRSAGRGAGSAAGAGGAARRGGRPGGDWVDPAPTNGPHLASRATPTPSLPRSGGTGPGALIDPGAPGASGRRQAASLDTGGPAARGAAARRRAGGADPGAGARPTGRFEAGVNGPSSTRRLGDVDPGRPPVASPDGRQLSDLDSGAPAGRSLRSTGDPDRRAGRPPAGLDPGPAGRRDPGRLDPGPLDTGPTGRRDTGPLDTGPTGRRDPGRRDSGRLESSRLDAGPTGRREPLIDPGAPGASGRRQAGARPLRGATAAGAAGLSGLPGRDDPLGAGAGVRRPTGENPAFADRLDGLVSRATPPHGHREGAPAPRPRDPLAAPRPEPRGAPPPADELPPTAPVPVARPPARPAPGPGPAPSVVPAPGRRPPYEPGYEEPYDDGYGVDGYDDSYGDEPYDEFDEDEPVDPERRSGCGRPVMILAGAGVLMVLVLLVAMFWVRGQIDPGGEPGDTVRVEIVAGQSTGEIGTVLEEAGVISSATLWPWYVRFKGGGDIQAGVYEIPTNLSMGEALDALADKPLPPGTKRVTIPEGQTIGEIRARVTEGEEAVAGFTPEGFDAALADPVVRSKHLPADQESLEGTFYPETYDLAEDATEVDLLTKMRDEFDATMDELGVDAGAEAVGLSPYEVLIVASIIEEEARVDEDRPRVARVIYNRLAEAPRLLFIDAINCYGAQMVPCIPNELDFEAESAYNSRKTPGLPPTPIAAPSRKSIEAALHPAEGPWTYYVLDPDLGEGRHLFTDSEQEFEAAKDRCRDAGLGCG